MNEIKVSIILPFYNESKIVEEIFKEVFLFSEENKDYEFIFVNDGSTDNTLELLGKILSNSKTKRIKIVSYKNNLGKGYAIRKGVEYAFGEFICFTDSDLAYSLDHLKLLVEKLKYYDLAIGCRNLSPLNEEKISMMRFIVGRGYNILTRIFFGFGNFDTQAGIKGFKKEVAKELFSKQKMNNYSFDVEIIYLAKKKGYSIGMIPATLSKNHKNRISKVSVVRDSLSMFFDLIKIKLNDFGKIYE